MLEDLLKVVKMPMKKIYHYLYTLDDLEEKDHPELHELDSYASDQNDSFRDVYSFLDRQYFDVSRSVVQNIVKYAESFFGDR